VHATSSKKGDVDDVEESDEDENLNLLLQERERLERIAREEAQQSKNVVATTSNDEKGDQGSNQMNEVSTFKLQ
jgi:hypothetical protein